MLNFLYQLEGWLHHDILRRSTHHTWKEQTKIVCTRLRNAKTSTHSMLREITYMVPNLCQCWSSKYFMVNNIWRNFWVDWIQDFNVSFSTGKGVGKLVYHKYSSSSSLLSSLSLYTPFRMHLLVVMSKQLGIYVPLFNYLVHRLTLTNVIFSVEVNDEDDSFVAWMTHCVIKRNQKYNSICIYFIK